MRWWDGKTFTLTHSHTHTHGRRWTYAIEWGCELKRCYRLQRHGQDFTCVRKVIGPFGGFCAPSSSSLPHTWFLHTPAWLLSECNRPWISEYLLIMLCSFSFRLNPRSTVSTGAPGKSKQFGFLPQSCQKGFIGKVMCWYCKGLPKEHTLSPVGEEQGTMNNNLLSSHILQRYKIPPTYGRTREEKRGAE